MVQSSKTRVKQGATTIHEDIAANTVSTSSLTMQVKAVTHALGWSARGQRNHHKWLVSRKNEVLWSLRTYRSAGTTPRTLQKQSTAFLKTDRMRKGHSQSDEHRNVLAKMGELLKDGVKHIWAFPSEKIQSRTELN